MIRVRTGSRLHFGLFSLPSEHAGPWLNQEEQPTIPRRQFGGVGLMIDKPGIELTVAKAERFSAEGPLAERALHFACTYRDCICAQEAFHIRVISAAPEHLGLGTGSQLGLAVARAIAELTGETARDSSILGSHIGRGKRSAIGIHGFEQGGLIVEAGKRRENLISPLIGRYHFPPDWNIILISPRDLKGVHGPNEIDAFADLEHQQVNERMTEALSRIALLGLVPAMLEHDIEAFGEALYDYNRRAGEMFQAVQGGVYAHPWTEKTIKIVRNAHVKGVGQSSWGPAVFAVVTPGQAFGLCELLTMKKNYQQAQIVVASACNHGAVLSTE